MNSSSAVVAIAIWAFGIASTAFAADMWDEGVVVNADAQTRGQSLDDKATYACAKTMLKTMFPGTRLIRVFANSRDKVFSDVYDEPGFEWSVLLEAADIKTGKVLGTAECDVTPEAQVVSLRPGAKHLPPYGA